MHQPFQFRKYFPLFPINILELSLSCYKSCIQFQRLTHSHNSTIVFLTIPFICPCYLIRTEVAEGEERTMEDDREPPGTDGEVEETDTQPLDENDIAGENPQDFQEVESQDNESAGPNSSFEKPAEHRKRHSRSHKERSSRHGRSHRKHHSSRHSKRSSREEIVYDEEYLYPDEGEKEPSRTMVKEADAEDGEILEDGEIASDEGDDRLPGMGVQRSMDDDEGKYSDSQLVV